MCGSWGCGVNEVEIAERGLVLEIWCLGRKVSGLWGSGSVTLGLRAEEYSGW